MSDSSSHHPDFSSMNMEEIFDYLKEKVKELYPNLARTDKNLHDALIAESIYIIDDLLLSNKELTVEKLEKEIATYYRAEKKYQASRKKRAISQEEQYDNPDEKIPGEDNEENIIDKISKEYGDKEQSRSERDDILEQKTEKWKTFISPYEFEASKRKTAGVDFEPTDLTKDLDAKKLSILFRRTRIRVRWADKRKERI